MEIKICLLFYLILVMHKIQQIFYSVIQLGSTSYIHCYEQKILHTLYCWL